MPDPTLKEQIKKLVELQKIDSEIYAIKSELEEKPQALESLKDEFDKEKQTLSDLEEKFKQIQLDRKAKELELQAKEDEIGKANAQLLQIKTNKEYTAKIHEIESIKADKSKIEELVLINYDEADKVKGEVEKEQQVVADKEKKYLEDKKVVDEEVALLQAKVTELDSHRNTITPGIDLNLLRKYERLLGNRKGAAMVAVYSGACGGCYMNLAPQVINALKLGEELVVCESCARILYLEDEL